MTDTRRKTVLISEPNAVNQTPYLPYIWAILKSYHERHGARAGAYEWLEPIYESGDPSALLGRYGGTPIDVLGLSCYTWNWDLQCRIAAQVKAANPKCLVVAGGPHPDYKDPQFFRKHPAIDLVVVHDGEVPFTRILDHAAGVGSLSDVRGLYYPDPTTKVPVSTGPAELPPAFDHSPYLDQREALERIVAARGENVFSAVLETNRGCPYACSFCDWGSSTMSKVRRFDMSRVKAEIEWLTRLKLWFIFLADANLGILPRDLEIADLLAGACVRSGYPKSFYYSPAKNNPDRSLEIARKFHASGLVVHYPLSVQHTRKEVLAATDRDNIPPEKMRELARGLRRHDIPTDVQLILGIPGDTYDLWKGCFTDLMEWGVHEDYGYFDYALLPNAPAGDRSFLERWEVQTAECFVSPLQVPRRRDNNDLMRCRVITASKTFSFDDWVRMNVFAALVRAFHCCGLTRFLALYLRFTHNVSYQSFYDDLIDNFMRQTPAARLLYDTLSAHFWDAAAGKCGLDELLAEQLPSLECYLSAWRWAFVQVCLDYDAFWDALAAHLLDRYPGLPALGDLISYQRNVVLLPDYDRAAGKTFPVSHDWLDYFARCADCETPGHLAEPEPRALAEVVCADTVAGMARGIPLDWNRERGERRWVRWIHRTLVHRSCLANNTLRDLTIRPRRRLPGGRSLRRILRVLKLVGG